MSASAANKILTKSEDVNKIMEFFKSLMTDSAEDLQKFIIGIGSLAITCAVFYTAYNDPDALTDKFYLYSVFGILPVAIGIIIASKMLDTTDNINKLYFYGGILFILIISMYFFYRMMNPTSVLLVSYILGFITFLGVLVGLAIIYRIFVRSIVNTRGWLGFFLKFLFLIPCLIIDLFETVFEELKVAPKMVVVLFILEMVIILAYIYMPRISNPSSEVVVLLNKPVFLTRLKAIGEAKQLFMDENEINNPKKAKNTIRQNYSISMWVYINQHSNTYAAYSKETNILRYGYPSLKTGHPRIAYFNDIKDTNNTDKVIVYVNGNVAIDGSGIAVQIQSQSWNYLVISYNESVVDIYVNGNLEKSVALPPGSTIKYNTGDIIEVGEGDNTVTRGGLHGAICNVVYYKTPLTPFQISANYNLNRYNNPPVNS